MAGRFRQIVEARRQRSIRSADYLEAEIDIPRDIIVPFFAESEGAFTMVYGEVTELIFGSVLNDLDALYLHSVVPGSHTLTVGLINETEAAYTPAYIKSAHELTIPLITETESVYTPEILSPDLLTVPLITEAEAVYQPASYISWTLNFKQSPGLVSIIETVYAPASYVNAPNTIVLDQLTNPGTLYEPTYVEAATGGALDLILSEACIDWGMEKTSGSKTFTEVTTNYLEVGGSIAVATTAPCSDITNRQYTALTNEVAASFSEEAFTNTVTVTTY